MGIDTSRRVWIIESPGIITEKGVWIEKFVYLPGTKAHSVTLRSYRAGQTIAAGSLSVKSGTIASTKTLTSTGNLPSDIKVGDVFEIYNTTGTTDNFGKKIIEVAGNNNDITIIEDDWTNEPSTKIYDWRTFSGRDEEVITANSENTDEVTRDFGEAGQGGKHYNNLICSAIGSGTLYIYTM